MQILFTFTFDTETQQGAMSGNVSPFEALQVLQQLVIADTVIKELNNRKEEQKKDE